MVKIPIQRVKFCSVEMDPHDWFWVKDAITCMTVTDGRISPLSFIFNRFQYSVRIRVPCSSIILPLTYGFIPRSVSSRLLAFLHPIIDLRL